jgi:hypothetical protein
MMRAAGLRPVDAFAASLFVLPWRPAADGDERPRELLRATAP